MLQSAIIASSKRRHRHRHHRRHWRLLASRRWATNCAFAWRSVRALRSLSRTRCCTACCPVHLAPAWQGLPSAINIKHNERKKNNVSIYAIGTALSCCCSGSLTCPITAIGVVLVALATLCSMMKNMYSSYSNRIKWKLPKLPADRSVRSRITIEL